MNETSDKPLSEELNELFAEKDTSGQVEAIRELFDKKNIRMKTDLNPKISEAEYFSKLFILSDLLKVPELKNYGKEVEQHRVSNNREGRREAVQMTRSVKPDEEKRGIMSWFR